MFVDVQPQRVLSSVGCAGRVLGSAGRLCTVSRRHRTHAISTARCSRCVSCAGQGASLCGISRGRPTPPTSLPRSSLASRQPFEKHRKVTLNLPGDDAADAARDFSMLLHALPSAERAPLPAIASPDGRVHSIHALACLSVTRLLSLLSALRHTLPHIR